MSGLGLWLTCRFDRGRPLSGLRSQVTTEKLKQELDALVKFPGLTNAWVMPIKTRIDMLATGIKTPVGIKVAGPNLNEIQKIEIGRAHV